MKLLKNNISEEQYVRERKADLNNKTNGNGEIWEQKWESAKDEIWKARFLELLKNTATSEKNILFKENLDTAEYTLIVEVVWIYPGWGSGWIDKMAEVTTILKIVETATPSNVLLEVESKKAIGENGGDDYSNESRIGGGFATTAKTFGKMIVSRTK